MWERICFDFLSFNKNKIHTAILAYHILYVNYLILIIFLFLFIYYFFKVLLNIILLLSIMYENCSILQIT
jgi:hypothetical protein